jgi:hypothetical protein
MLSLVLPPLLLLLLLLVAAAALTLHSGTGSTPKPCFKSMS